MDIFFADDSQQNGAREAMGRIVAFGGVFLADEALRPFEEEVNKTCSSFKLPKGEELKWSPRKDSWIYKNLLGDDRRTCYAAVLSSAVKLGARCLVVAWDSGRTYIKGEQALEKCVHYAFERMEVHLGKRKTLGLMVADRPGGGRKQEEDLLSAFLKKVQNGTEYVVPKSVVLNVVTTPSHLVRHLQLADLVVGTSTAMVAGQYDYAKPLFEIIRPTFIRNYNDTAGGTGLKLFPDDLQNLYHWILGETVFWKVGRNIGFSIPDKALPYAIDEFKVMPPVA